MTHFQTRLYGPLLLLLVLAADFARAEILFGDGFELAPEVTRHLEVSPGAILLTAVGESETLTVSVFDDDGQPVFAPVEFSSSRPEVVSVSETGEVTAGAGVGSAQIVVATDDALEVAVMVVVADPVADALLIADEQVVSGPDLVDPDAELAPGLELRFVFSDIGVPLAGTSVIGTGELPVGGRVVSAAAVAGGVEVVLEAVAARELFDAYAIDETMDAATAPLVLAPEVAALYDLRRRADGRTELRLRPDARGSSGTRELSINDNCEATPNDLTAVVQGTLGAGIDFIPEFEFHLVDSDAGLERFVLEGSALTVAEFSTRTSAALNGKVTCKYKLGTVNFPPPPGPLAVLLEVATDFGVGFEFAGLVGFTDTIGYDVTVTARAEFRAGIECPGGVCESVGSSSAEADGAFNPVYPPNLDALLGSAKLQLDGSGFFFIDLGVQNPFLESIGFKPFDLRAGLRQRLDLEAPQAQATNPAYGSDFRLELFAAAGATTQFESLLNLLGIVVPPLVVEAFEVLAQSPQGTLVITDPNGGSSATPGNPATVQAGTEDEPGELATFEVNLNPATYLGLYAVEEVRVLELVDDGAGGQTLESVSSLCTDLDPDPGQTTFTCQTDFLEAGTRQFYLFVRASLFGVPLPFLLEAGNETQATLEVEDVPVRAEGLLEIEPFGFFTRLGIGEMGLSADTRFVVGRGRTVGNGSAPFRWSDSGESISLPIMGGFRSQARAVSDDGTVVVGSGENNAFWWSETEGFRLLGTLAGPGSASSQAYDTSADGTVVVGRAGVDPLQPRRHAFRWVNGVMTDLGTFGNGSNSWAWAVSADGNVVVGQSSNDTNTATVAFRWTEASGMQPIGTIRGWAVAKDVSVDGSVIVGDGLASDGFGRVPFRWEDGIMTELDTPVGFSSDVGACCVSADGSVVVGNAFNDDTGDSTPWRWTAETGVQTLRQWFTANGLPAPPIEFPIVEGLSADGRTMLIYATSASGERTVYLATAND